jgi:hypothetical protein
MNQTKRQKAVGATVNTTKITFYAEYRLTINGECGMGCDILGLLLQHSFSHI